MPKGPFAYIKGVRERTLPQRLVACNAIHPAQPDVPHYRLPVGMRSRHFSRDNLAPGPENVSEPDTVAPLLAQPELVNELAIPSDVLAAEVV
jgi:hypothetical protein